MNCKRLLLVLMVIFVVMMSYLFIPFPHSFKRALFPLMAILALAFFALGIVLIVMTVKKKVKSPLKWFLILTGASSAAVFPSVILHNLVYGLFIYWFGEGFWERIGLGDEPFFFILALVVSPIVFLVGSVGSVVLLIKRKRAI